MNTINSAKQLAEILNKSASTTDEINQAIDSYYDVIKNTEDADKVALSMKYLTPVFSLENLDNGVTASLICGTLVEHQFSPQYITEDYIAFFKNTFEKAQRFIKVCEDEIHRVNTNEIEEQEYEVIDRLAIKYKEEMKNEIAALNALDKYYSCGVSIFSSDVREWVKGKKHLSFISKYASFGAGFLWLSRLFDVLFFEPVLVIDLNTKRGIIGQMSGIVDNFQLQLILMGLKELNENIKISPKEFDIVTGYDVQSMNKSIIGQWNMYNWEYLKDEALKKDRETNDWIWSEGKPGDISLYNDKRVILLDNPSYHRGLPVQRSFKNLVAEITIDKVLEKKEVVNILSEMKKSANNKI